MAAAKGKYGAGLAPALLEAVSLELTRAPIDVDAELDLGGYRVGIVLALHGARRARPSV